MILSARSFSANPEVTFNFTVEGAPGGTYMSGNFAEKGAPTANPEQFNWNDSLSDPNNVSPTWSIDWDFLADPDPNGLSSAKLASVFTVRNLLNEVPVENPKSKTPIPHDDENHLIFTILITLPVQNVGPDTTFFGNTSLTLEAPPSTNGYMGRIESVGPPGAWTGLIDGTDSLSLWDHFFFAQASGGTTNSPDNPTQPELDALAGLVPTTIGIRLWFDLTPGETVTFNGIFGFIPSPGALALFVVAGFGSIRRRRRN